MTNPPRVARSEAAGAAGVCVSAGHSRRPSWRQALGQGVLLVLLLALVFPGVFLRGEVIAPGDILFQTPPWERYAPGPTAPPDTYVPLEPGSRARTYYPQNWLMSDVVTAFFPYYTAIQMAWDAGEWPLWNPLELAGMPLLANYQSAVLYPPRLLYALFDIPVATTLYILLKLWLSGMTAYLCGRGMGLGDAASRFLSIVWMLCSYSLIWCNWPLPDVSAWAPLLLLAAEWMFERRYRQGTALLALSATLMLLAGHPETAFAFGLLIGAYFFLRLVVQARAGGHVWQPAAAAAAGWAIALAVCTPQLLPFAEYLRHSDTWYDRAAGISDQHLPALPPYTAVSLWVPRFFGTAAEYNFWGELNSNLTSMIYLGMPTLLAVGWLLTRWRRSSHVLRVRTRCMAAAAAVAFLLGYDIPPGSYLHLVPPFNTMIVSYYLAPIILFMAVLGAGGMQEWFSERRQARELWGFVPVLAPGILLVAGLWYTLGGIIGAVGVETYVLRQLALTGIFSLAALSLFAGRVFLRRPAWAVACLCALTVADLITAARGLNPMMPREHLYPETALTDYVSSLEGHNRFGIAEGGIASGSMAPYGIEEWLGYDGLYPMRVRRLQRELRNDIWNGMIAGCGVNYFLHNPTYPPVFPLEETPERFEFMAAHDGLEVYRLTTALPRAYLVGEIEHVPETRAIFQRMRERGFDPAERVVTQAPGFTLPDTREPLDGHAKVLSRTPNRVEVAVESNRAAALVLADAYYPGWRAYIDGERAELFPAYTAFRGVIVPAGAHAVEFQYRPASLRLGLWLASITLLGTWPLAWRAMRGRRGTTATPGFRGTDTV